MASKKRELTLSPRLEETRNERHISTPIQFSLDQIKEHFSESMEEIKKQLIIADHVRDDGNDAACKTIWRSQIVLAEGILDFYIHEISKYCLARMFSGVWEKSERYYTFQVPMKEVEQAIYASKPNSWFFDYLNERFKRDVYLSQESMKDQLNLIGIGFKDAMLKAFPDPNGKESISRAKNIIKELFKRRNEIAHQLDRSHASAEQNDITKEYVEDYISKVEAIVNAIHDVAEEKDNEQLIE